MKKFFVCLVLGLVCGLMFAKDYVVEKSKGTVKYELSSGVLNKIKKGQSLDGKTYITLDKNSTLEILDENGNAIQIKGPYRGALENSFKKDNSNRKPGLLKSGSQKNDNAISTNSPRTETFRPDLEWEEEWSDVSGIDCDLEDEENRFYNVDYIDGITDEEYLNEYCAKSENREKLLSVLIWCNEKPGHERYGHITKDMLGNYLASKYISNENVEQIVGYLEDIDVGGGSIEDFSYKIEDETYHMFFFFEVVE